MIAYAKAKVSGDRRDVGESEVVAPWGYRDNGPGELDALPSQLLFATLLLSMGRVETARHSKSEESISSMPTYWELTILLICLGVAALWYLAVTQPVAQ